MQTTFDGWIMNPMVKDNSVFTHRDMYRTLYTNKFDKINLREAGKIEYALYIDKKKDEYYAHIRIPSEVVDKFYYDVVVQFYTKNPIIKATRSLKDYSVRFYSNDPAFVFTYLRVFKKNDMFIEDLSARTPKQALNKDPKEKNPYEVISYVKSLYFAYLLMKAKNLFSKIQYETYGTPYDAKTLVAKVRHADIVIKERQEKGEEVEKKKREEKNKLKQDEAKQRLSYSNNRQTNTPDELRVSHTTNVSSTKKTGLSSSITHSKTTKKSKKI